jgi:hypothetical protein
VVDRVYGAELLVSWWPEAERQEGARQEVPSLQSVPPVIYLLVKVITSRSLYDYQWMNPLRRSGPITSQKHICWQSGL